MPQYIGDGVTFNFNANPSDWPTLSCGQVNLLALRNSDLQLDAARSLRWQGHGQLSFEDDGQIGARGALSLHTGETQAERLRITPDGNIGLGKTPHPDYKLDVAGALNATSFALNGAPLSMSQWVNVSDGINFANGNVGIDTPTPKAKLHVNGVVQAAAFVSSPLVHRMYPKHPVIYQNIFDAIRAGAISKLGNPQYDDSTYSETANNPWNDRYIIRFGSNNEIDGNGAVVTIPAGYDTVWVRVLGDRWTALKGYFLDAGQEALGLWAGGYRAANCYCPDGSLSDGYDTIHQWLPIPAGRAGKLALIVKPNTTADFWLSGLAFSQNPWAHSMQSAVTYHWALNGGEATTWGDGWENWNSDVMSRIEPKSNLELRVPVIPSGRDKLLYLVEHNNSWNGCMHNGITVNGQPIERFSATYDNPFARHWNSKYFCRYIAACIPAALISAGAKYISVHIDMSKQNNGIHFREIGTHDLDVPTNWSQ